MAGTGRLPGLNQGAAKPGLKFKPKALARRSKEEREKAIPKTATEEVANSYNNKKKYSKRDQGNRQKRVPKYLLNTRVVGAGFGAENFAGGGLNARTGFIKSEGGPAGHPDLMQLGMKQMNGGVKGLDDEEDSDGGDGHTRINMGREYRSNEVFSSDDEKLDTPTNEAGEIDEEALRSKRLAHFFPVRAVRVRHEDMDVVQKELKDSLSDNTTREPTPGTALKQEESGLPNVLQQRDFDLQDKLNALQLQNEFASVDSQEGLDEVKRLNQDYVHIVKKLSKINDQPGKFMFFQLPAVLPDFETPPAPAEEPSHATEAAKAVETTDEAEAKIEADSTVKTDDSQNTDSKEQAPVAEAPATEAPKDKKLNGKKEAVSQDDKPLAGNIGSLRVHKSGRLSVKIGNVIMDINRGAENTFMQEVVALDERAEERTVELLGQIMGKAVVTPKF
ncbi:LAME_0B06678g1_1 [Lachancea meyersii CBS 8951]|uniref:LAME_0B06678g1_1 n=1 Tax=Lachancea meyersii CBS 8951 TaxID=1266667 RepID=A0A1G4IWP4_9SACH|nr:LAME_0B06678g1_1 [Lachancea meyersii CBS 8951]